jgi:hypothetical protein
MMYNPISLSKLYPKCITDISKIAKPFERMLRLFTNPFYTDSSKLS